MLCSGGGVVLTIQQGFAGPQGRTPRLQHFVMQSFQGGEAIRFVMQFKQYGISFVQKVLGRYSEEDRFWSIPGSLFKMPASEAAQLAQLMFPQFDRSAARTLLTRTHGTAESTRGMLGKTSEVAAAAEQSAVAMREAFNAQKPEEIERAESGIDEKLNAELAAGR